MVRGNTPLKQAEEHEQTFKDLKAAPTLTLPEISKLFHLYGHERKGIAKGVLTVVRLWVSGKGWHVMGTSEKMVAGVQTPYEKPQLLTEWTGRDQWHMVKLVSLIGFRISEKLSSENIWGFSTFNKLRNEDPKWWQLYPMEWGQDS